MRKLLIILGILFISCTSVFAAKLPDDVKNYINNNVPGADIRFDGVIIFPSNTIYLPFRTRSSVRRRVMRYPVTIVRAATK